MKRFRWENFGEKKCRVKIFRCENISFYCKSFLSVSGLLLFFGFSLSVLIERIENPEFKIFLLALIGAGFYTTPFCINLKPTVNLLLRNAKLFVYEMSLVNPVCNSVSSLRRLTYFARSV